jgi:hypothetical protein
MINKVIDKLTSNNTNTNTNTNTNNDNKQNEINKKLIEVKNFRQIEDYCCNGYQEFFDNISTNSLEIYRVDLIRKVLSNDDPEMFEYLLKRLNKFNLNDLIDKFRFAYCKDSKNFKNMIKILIDHDSDIKNIFLSDQYFRFFCVERKLDIVKEIHRLRIEKGNSKIKLNITEITISNYSDPNVFYWLIDEDFFDFNSINPQMLEKTKVKLLREYLRSNRICLDVFKNLIDKLNFKTTNLKEMFNKSYGYECILEDLITRGKREVIYYLFEHIKPEDMINKDKKSNYIRKLIITNDYELFMFVMHHLASLKSLFDFTYFENSHINESICDNTDYQIIYELLKLEIEPKKGNKYFELCKMIKTISKKNYLL